MASHTYHLIETTLDLMIAKIKSEISDAMIDQRGLHTDAKVSTELPKNYFTYQKAAGYQTPAVFVIPNEIDYRKDQKGANFVNAKMTIFVAVLVEDRSEENLSKKAYRYHAALSQILDEAAMVSYDNGVKIVVIPVRTTFSGIESRDVPHQNDTTFRQEIVMECAVEHWENMSGP